MLCVSRPSSRNSGPRGSAALCRCGWQQARRQDRRCYRFIARHWGGSLVLAQKGSRYGLQMPPGLYSFQMMMKEPNQGERRHA
jgi:hypothetical protein